MKTTTWFRVRVSVLALLVTFCFTIAANGQNPNQSNDFGVDVELSSSAAEKPAESTTNNRMITPTPAYTFYYENFDIDNGGWTPTTATNDAWAWVTSFSTNEMNEGGFWRNNNYNNYSNNVNISIESPQFDFTGLTNLRLSLDVKYKVQDNNDGMIIAYSISGGAWTTLFANGTEINWYEDNAAVFGHNAWNGDGHTASPSFNPHNQFTNARIDLTNATFAGQSNVRFRIQFQSDGSSTDDGVAFDNFRIEADPTSALNDASIAPANITSNLRLWLKMNAGVAASDGGDLTLWEDQAYDTSLDKEDATAASYLAPTYRDNANRNINYNPIADFDHNNREYMNGKGGYYSQDYFAVFRSDDVVSRTTGSIGPGRQFAIGGRFSDKSFHEDPTGLGVGSTSGRYSNEIISHTIDSYPNGSTSGPDADSYGRAYTGYSDHDHVMLINVKTNAAGTASEIYKNGKRVDNVTGTAGNGAELNFVEFHNLPYLIGAGRSGMAGRSTSQLNGMLGEIVSYSTPNSALNQQKIQSYLGIKYGVTLQASASTLSNYRRNDVDYIDASGNVIWDTSAHNGHNYDIAGIGRDDDSQLDQKQSMSQNIEVDGVGPTSGFLTMGLTTVYDTNNLNIASNATTLNNQEFLMWGNNNASLDGSPINVTVDMSTGISGAGAPVTEVEFTAIPRIWKVVETGGNVPSVQVKIPTSVVRTATPPDGRYLMFISATGIFDPTADYRVMTESGGYLTAEYDFTGIEYITFGWAPEREFTRSIYFNPSNGDYVDVGDNLDLDPTGFTISAWVKRDAADSGTKSILSKRAATFNAGYDLFMFDDNRVRFSWYSGASLQTITTLASLPDDEWHQIAVIYNGSSVNLYIDGVLDRQGNRSAPTDTSDSFLIGAAARLSPTQLFRGNIDEVRVWDTDLTIDQLRFIMNQEIEDNSNFVGGSYFMSRGITPTKEDVDTLPWNDLAGYYPMSVYTYTNTRDESGNGNTGALRNLRTVDWQTAPLPYISTQNGDWDKNTPWLNGDVQAIPGTQSIVDSNVTVDWNIVQTSHNLDMDNSYDLPAASNGNRTLLALVVDSNEITVQGDNVTNEGYGLTITHYLELDGDIDLEGESQLIQTEDSDLAVSSAGKVERDQQGTADVHTYNYWSSPVGVSNTTSNNNSYTLPDVMRDGTQNINWITSGYDGANTNPIGIADYWIWKFANQPDDDYSAWQHVRSTGTLLAGEGFTMKGPGSGAILDDQNYVFTGKPNNGDVNLSITTGNDYLVGNPYPSAIDAHQFILDNAPIILGSGATTGTLYFWEHWGGGSHILQEYQGGYATYNLSGGTPAASYGTNDPDVATGGTPTKRPGRYIPVGQGFFVIAENAGGTINFNNGQRVFQKESSSSVFMSPVDLTNARNVQSGSGDVRSKIRLGFYSVNDIHRELLVTLDENATAGKDWGYDAINYDDQMDDMYWMIDGEKYNIQGTDDMEETTVYPLGLHTSEDGENRIAIDALENIDNDVNIYLHDKRLNIYHDLRAGDYKFSLSAGAYVDRFEITFAEEEVLDVEEFDINTFDVNYTNDIESIVLTNTRNVTVDKIELINILGQQVFSTTEVANQSKQVFEIKHLSVGTYIIKVKTPEAIYAKKVLVK